MPSPDLSAALAGRVWAGEPTRVCAKAVQAFADALGVDGDPVPPTWPITLVTSLWEQMLAEAGATLEGVVHAQQAFEWHRRILVGDEVQARLRVDRLREREDGLWLWTTAVVARAEEPCVTSTSLLIVPRGRS